MTIQPDTIEVPSAEERTRILAYQLWEDEGCPDGRADDHWARAAELVRAGPAAEAQPFVVEPGWLQRELPVAAAKPLSPPEITQTLEQLSRRIAGKSAAA
jgi:hypothetical protein